MALTLECAGIGLALQPSTCQTLTFITDLRPLLEAVHELRAKPVKSSSSTSQPDDPIEKVAWSGDETNCEMNQSSSQYYHFPVTALDSSCRRCNH